MEAMELKRLPVGIQTYEKLVDNNCLYVDKTQFIYKMIKLGNYIFLSRPRRFGKSLLVSTLEAYFEGKKHLFKGTFIDGVEKDWTEYPVLRFDMSTAKHVDAESLTIELAGKLTDYEKIYGPNDASKPNLNQRLEGLIQRAYELTGKQVVVLIDEYDAPLLDVAHEKTQLDDLRQIMRNFYSPLKACDKYLKFVFITGITKFSQLSIFSELNNLKNISMNPEFAAVCGISEEEIETQMSDYLDNFASVQESTRQEAMTALKKQYDGYHFAWPSPDIYNPFSLLNAFQDNTLNSYWFESGTPTFLIEMMRKFNVTPSMLKPTNVMASGFDAPTENLKSITPLLYQSGYLTIKGYNRMANIYTLDIPNNEIRIGLMESLLPNYVNIGWENGLTTIAYMFMALYNDDLNEMLRLLQTYLLTIPQCDNTNYEGHYQQMLYV
ncbi:MAG: AAA family ATPase, partial [Bacteroidales bacterium]|nr:AAA family ATPase [Bacteroidales bacterium]